MLSQSIAPLSLDVSDFGCIRNGRVLLRHISFHLDAGQVLLVQGGNGSGKSTLLRSLAGLMTWRAGTLTFCGEKLLASSPSLQQKISYLGHQCGMSDGLTGAENLGVALQLQGIAWDADRVATVLKQWGVAEVAHRPMFRLSQGQRRRLAIARVLLSGRPVWLLDEPDNSLDVVGSELLQQALAEHARTGGLAVVVSHRNLFVPDTRTQILELSSEKQLLTQVEHTC
jgi:heme exporter protein A